jgi:protein-S-isoprenylcysteine O-methyltransferase Ste14
MAGPYWEIISGCWVMFWVYWTISARRFRAPRREVSLTFTVLNTVLLYSGFVLVLASRVDVGPLALRFTSGAELADVLTIAWLVGPLALRFTSGAAYIDIAGTALAVAGVAFAIWSRRVLGLNWSGAVRITEGQHLVRAGPYAVVRNPIYSGMVLAVFGTALVAGTISALLGLALVVASLWHKGRMEERFLLAEFGEEYAAYQRDVKFLIPFIV